MWFGHWHLWAAQINLATDSANPGDIFWFLPKRVALITFLLNSFGSGFPHGFILWCCKLPWYGCFNLAYRMLV